MNITILILLILSSLYPPEDVCLSEDEKQLFSLINEYRKKKKLPPIPYSVSLTKVAQAHVKDLHHNYEFNPDAPCNPHSWSKKGDWSSCCYTNDHKMASCMWSKPKEIAGYESNGFEIAYYQSDGAMAFAALEGWKNSQGHNPLLINTGIWEKLTWGGMGIGIYEEYAAVWFGLLKEEGKIKVCD